MVNITVIRGTIDSVLVVRLAQHTHAFIFTSGCLIIIIGTWGSMSEGNIDYPDGTVDLVFWE